MRGVLLLVLVDVLDGISRLNAFYLAVLYLVVQVL